MITEQDLRQAIAECEGVRNPSATTCVKLASFYTILNQMQGRTPVSVNEYSFENRSEQVFIPYSDSEFSQAVEHIGFEKAFPVLDELMSILSAINPSLYSNVLKKLRKGAV